MITGVKVMRATPSLTEQQMDVLIENWNRRKKPIPVTIEADGEEITVGTATNPRRKGDALFVDLAMPEGADSTAPPISTVYVYVGDPYVTRIGEQKISGEQEEPTAFRSIALEQDP